MSPRRLSQPDAAADSKAVPATPRSGLRRRVPVDPEPMRAPATARSRGEAEERYTVAHDAWIKAMRHASSGRPADLATLAIAQESYEAALAERAMWEAGKRIAVPIDADPGRAGIELAVGQELAWRQVRDAGHRPRGGLSRLFGLFGRFRRR